MRTAQQHIEGQGGGGGEEEVEGRAEEGSGGGQGAETNGRPEKQRGEFRQAGGRRTRTTSEQIGQGGGWATLLLSCLLLGYIRDMWSTIRS